jgi:tRNA-specific 2-thiouridylase
MSKGKVLVAMSGGVDSSVALLKIVEMGYEPIGITMKLWEYKDVGGNLVDDSNCCSVGAINNAKLVCDRMGFPHYTLDFTDVFRETVVDNFADEYISGRTPNPCVRCNSFVKWDAFVEQADILGADYIATGHYAKAIKRDGRTLIQRGVDMSKDQSYVLWGIPPHTLERTLFPLGDLTKKEVRHIANEHNLETANIPESMEICFVADNNYKRFLNDYVPEKMESIPSGHIKDESGEVVGTHTGYTNYTVGQRKGLGLSNPEPRYVKSIDAQDNTIIVTKKTAMYSESCYAVDTNWFIHPPKDAIEVMVQIRYNSNGTLATVEKDGEYYKINFKDPQLAVTPGQSVVFFDDDVLLGGGIIETEKTILFKKALNDK